MNAHGEANMLEPGRAGPNDMGIHAHFVCKRRRSEFYSNQRVVSDLITMHDEMNVKRKALQLFKEQSTFHKVR